MTANGLNRRVPGAREWTSYQRLVTALHHREPDRVQFDLGGLMVTGINVRALTALRRVLGLPGEAQVLDRVTQMRNITRSVRFVIPSGMGRLDDSSARSVKEDQTRTDFHHEATNFH